MYEFFIDLFRASDKDHISLIVTATDPDVASRAAEALHPGYEALTLFPTDVFVSQSDLEGLERITA